jgi:hypothetical protein
MTVADGCGLSGSVWVVFRIETASDAPRDVVSTSSAQALFAACCKTASMPPMTALERARRRGLRARLRQGRGWSLVKVANQRRARSQ